MALLASGAYIAFTGWERRKAVSEALDFSGIVKSDNPMDSILTGQKCAYLRATVEKLSGNQTAPIAEMELRPRFRLNGVLFDPERATIDTKESVFTGFLRKEEGTLDVFLASSLPKTFLDLKATERLLSLPEAKSKLAPHRKSMLRITETSIPDGCEIFVLAKPPKNQHESPRPILISTSSASKARESLSKTANTGMTVGAILILVGLAVLFLY